MRHRLIQSIRIFLFAFLMEGQLHSTGQAWPEYVPVSGIAGNLDAVGSDSLNNLMTMWAEAFRRIYPNVNIQIDGKGSSTAPPALIEGMAQIGPMSRTMKQTEIDQFRARFGYAPTRIEVAIDALAVYVHKDNPLEGISLDQLDGIFSSTLKRGGDPVRTWGELGLDGTWGPRRISLYGRNSASGTYGFFKNIALANGDYRNTVKEQPGSSGVVQGVSQDVYGMGYSGIGYRNSSVKPLSIASSPSQEAVSSSIENCLSGAYPLARLLYVYVNRHPTHGADPLVREFLKFILSQDGQEIVRKDGYYPIPPSISHTLIDGLDK